MVALITYGSLDDKLIIVIMLLLPSVTGKDEIRMKLEATLGRTVLLLLRSYRFVFFYLTTSTDRDSVVGATYFKNLSFKLTALK